jgi:hypothetical protein
MFGDILDLLSKYGDMDHFFKKCFVPLATLFCLSTGCEISPKTKSPIQQAAKKDVVVHLDTHVLAAW